MQAGTRNKTELSEINALVKKKPRIIDAGLYSISNRFGTGLRSWLAPRLQPSS